MFKLSKFYLFFAYKTVLKLRNTHNHTLSKHNFATADHFGVWFNGYNDGQQDIQFYVSAANGQADCNFTSQNGEDYSWNAIFYWQIDTNAPSVGRASLNNYTV